MKYIIHSHEFGIDEILISSWHVFRSHFGSLFKIAVIVYLPFDLLIAYILSDMFSEKYGTKYVVMYVERAEFIQMIIGLIAIMAIARLTHCVVSEKNVVVKDILNESLLKFPFLLGTFLMEVIFLGGLFLLLVIPGIIFSVYWFFSLYSVLFYNKAWKSALDHSKEIVSGRWFRVCFISVIIIFIAVFTGSVLGNIIESPLYGSFFPIILIRVFIHAVTSYFAVVQAVFFLNFDATKKAQS